MNHNTSSALHNTWSSFLLIDVLEDEEAVIYSNDIKTMELYKEVYLNHFDSKPFLRSAKIKEGKCEWNIENIDAIYPKNRVFVYNRWGNLIYESIEGGYNQMQWNGSYNGESLPVGTYYFIIEYNDNFTKSSNGIVTIIK